MAKWTVIEAELSAWLNEYEGKRFHAIISDPPYALISIAKRFGKKNSAPAKEGSDGRYSRLSSGFMGQKWDGFRSLPDYQDWIKEWATLLIEKALHPGAVALFFGGPRTFHHLGVGLERGGFEIIDVITWLYGQGFPKAHEIVPGYFTALKPAWEPIYLCRAPRGDLTFKQLEAEYGTGGLNIDGNRIPAEGYMVNTFDDGAKPFGDAVGEAYTGRIETRGRWPANLTLDEEAALALGNQARFFYCSKASKAEKDKGLGDFYWAKTGRGPMKVHFKQWAKLEEEDRAEGNIHPTVKPITLTRHLASLIMSPEDDNRKSRILVPFSGSGSEMIGAAQAGFDEVVGIEKDSDYNEVANKRIAANVGMF